MKVTDFEKFDNICEIQRKLIRLGYMIDYTNEIIQKFPMENFNIKLSKLDYKVLKFREETLTWSLETIKRQFNELREYVDYLEYKYSKE